MSIVFGQSSVLLDNKEESKSTDPQAAADAAKPAKVEAPPEIGQMRRGDYLIHVFIEQARQLKTPAGKTIDPLIEVEVMGQKKFTTAKDDIGGASAQCSWNEHIFFEPRNVEKEEIEQAKISVRVLDKGYFKDSIVGLYDFDVSYIYFMVKHSLLHRWVALSNPQSENYNQIAGYLKLSIAVTTMNDETINITEDSGTPESNELPIIMPPQLQPTYQQIKIRLFRAEKLPMLDLNLLSRQGNSIDAYLQVNFLNFNLRTQPITAYQDQPIDWNTEILLPLQQPIMSSRCVLKIFDQDKTKDEIVGSILINLKDYIGDSDLNGKIMWRNIYGSPLKCSGTNTDMMNANPEIASNWKGRVLMQIVAESTEKPAALQRPMQPDVIALAQPFFQLRDFDVIAEVGAGISLPDSSKYAVKITIGDYQVQTSAPLLVKTNYNRWLVRFPQTTFRAPYASAEDIGRVFVYLMDGDSPICYWKGDTKDFTNPNAELKWVEMTNDLAVGKIKEANKAGIISFKLSIVDRSPIKPINFVEEYSKAWPAKPPKRLSVRSARVFIYQCRDLPNADNDSQSDPYVDVFDFKNPKNRTNVVWDNNNPIFFETLKIDEIECYTGIDDLPPFVLDIYDKDNIVKDDFLGRAVINVKDSAFTEDYEKLATPRWHPIRMSPSNTPQGEILVSFFIFNGIDGAQPKNLDKKSIADTVKFDDYQIDIEVLGLRNLQSGGILPIKKAFIQFNLKSLVSPSEGTALENIKTQPGPTGPNPTINSSISFKVPLPTDPLYCPKLVCTVYDYIFVGMNQPLIGSFTIPVGELIHKIQKEREDEIEEIREVIDGLQKIITGEVVIPSYNVKPPAAPGLDVSLNRVDEGSIRENNALIQSVKQQIKKSIKIEEEIKQPLLENYEDRNSLKLPENLSLGGSARPRMPTRVNIKTMKTMQTSIEEVKEGDKNQRLKTFKFETVDKFNDIDKQRLIEEYNQQQEMIKNQAKEDYERDLQDFKRSGGKNYRNVVMPQYEFDETLKSYREVNQPPESMFIGIGWDEFPPDQKRKHYRRFYPKELEKVKMIMPKETPFSSFDIMRGQSRGASKSWWPFGMKPKQDEAGQVTTEMEVGKFKGIVTVQSQKAMKAYEKAKDELLTELKQALNEAAIKISSKPFLLDISKLETSEGRMKLESSLEDLGLGHFNVCKHIAELQAEDLLTRMLLHQQKCTVKVYIIDAFNLSSRDNGSESDPYLILSCGNRVYNERQNYQQDQPNPEFYKMYQFDGVFPGSAPLVIKLMDYDDIFGDELIGETSIDLEDRYFSTEWQCLKNKPIEYRQLNHPSSSISQGTLRMWFHIIPVSVPADQITEYDITPKPAEDFEIRISVFDTLDIKSQDVEGTSDIYVRAFFDSKDAKETDTHYRCTNGKASFNYRLLFPFQHPQKNQNYNLSLQLYDRDFFKSNDLIGDALLNIMVPIEDVAISKRPLKLTKQYYENYLKKKQPQLKLEFKDDTTFYLPVKQRDPKTGQVSDEGKIRIQVDILLKNQAEANKVGAAREEPNHSPYLPPPVGRIQFNLYNPWKMFTQLVGPGVLRKIYCYCIWGSIISLCLFLLPIIFSDIISNLISKAIGIL